MITILPLIYEYDLQLQIFLCERNIYRPACIGSLSSIKFERKIVNNIIWKLIIIDF